MTLFGISVTVPIASFRKGSAREYLETEALPPPSTCYGFLLSLVGEVDRDRHHGVRIAPALLSEPSESVVLRTIWRVKQKRLGSPGNTRPDFQVILTDVQIAIWLDSSEESRAPTLEQRVSEALEHPEQIQRFGGLSLGESTHLIDTVSPIEESGQRAQVFLLTERGGLSLPVWVDHVGSTNTQYARGQLIDGVLAAPGLDQMPKILPPAPPKKGRKTLSRKRK